MIIQLPGNDIERIAWHEKVCGKDTSDRYFEHLLYNLHTEQKAEVIQFPRRDMTPKPAA